MKKTLEAMARDIAGKALDDANDIGWELTETDCTGAGQVLAGYLNEQLEDVLAALAEGLGADIEDLRGMLKLKPPPEDAAVPWGRNAPGPTVDFDDPRPPVTFNGERIGSLVKVRDDGTKVVGDVVLKNGETFEMELTRRFPGGILYEAVPEPLDLQGTPPDLREGSSGYPNQTSKNVVAAQKIVEEARGKVVSVPKKLYDDVVSGRVDPVALMVDAMKKAGEALGRRMAERRDALFLMYLNANGPVEREALRRRCSPAFERRER